MNNKISLVLVTASLTGCLSLPEGSDSVPRHYTLLPAQGNCSVTTTGTLNIDVSRVAAGLDSDRVASLSGRSGELAYIKGMRWASDARTMLEQRLAADLETAGFSVTTSHHKLGITPELSCEIRQFNLLREGATYSARFALSCVLYKPGQQDYQPLQSSAEQVVSQLNTGAIATALSASYSEGFGALCRDLNVALESQD